MKKITVIAMAVLLCVVRQAVGQGSTTYVVQECFDGLSNGSLSGQGDGTSSYGFATGSVWYANDANAANSCWVVSAPDAAPRSGYTADQQDDITSGNPLNGNGGGDTLPGPAPQMGGNYYTPGVSQGDYAADLWASTAGFGTPGPGTVGANTANPFADTNAWCARQLANPINFNAAGTYYFSFRLQNPGATQNGACVGIGFASGITPTDQLLAVGVLPPSNAAWGTSSNPLHLYAQDNTLGNGIDATFGSGSFAISSSATVNNAAVELVCQLVTTVGGNNTLSVKKYTTGSLPADPSSISWDLVYNFTDTSIMNQLVVYMPGGYWHGLDAIRVGTQWTDLTNFPAASTQTTPPPPPQQPTWSVVLPADPVAGWTNNGTVIKASNFGPLSGGTINIQPVTVAGINFDTDLSNVTTGGDGNDFNSGYIPENPPITQYYYSGSDSSVSNLVNTFAWVHEWWYGDPDEYLGITFTNLVVGDNYQFQLMVGFPWDGDGLNVYGGDAANTYLYWASGDGQGQNAGIATFTWTATTNSGTFYVTEPYLYAEHELMGYALIDTSETSTALTISAPKLLGGGQFQLTINSSPNTILDIQISHDLVNWTTSQTVTNISGADTFIDSSATSSPTFYRLREE